MPIKEIREVIKLWLGISDKIAVYLIKGSVAYCSELAPTRVKTERWCESRAKLRVGQRFALHASVEAQSVGCQTID